jgi:DNA-binding GntR family transcriptional regulator
MSYIPPFTRASLRPRIAVVLSRADSAIKRRANNPLIKAGSSEARPFNRQPLAYAQDMIHFRRGQQSDDAMTVAETIQVPISESLYQRIRADILFGRIPPGQKLRLDRLKAHYGAGISTLREILSRLSAEGLVLAEGQRGFEVPPVTGENLRELADLRLLLESHALMKSFAAGDMEWEGRVVAAHHKLETTERRMLADGKGEAEPWKRYDCEFHQALISACGSHELMAAHAGTFDRYLRYLMVAFCFRGEPAIVDHRALRDAALARDADAATAVLERHINDCVDFALASGAVR